jgi:hypothetical protein
MWVIKGGKGGKGGQGGAFGQFMAGRPFLPIRHYLSKVMLLV